MKRSEVFTLSGAAVSAFLLSAVFASAAPPKITETFDTGDDGWEIYESGSESSAAWVAAGGNPGGFIRYEDASAAGSDALFADADYVSNISRYSGDPIVVDLRAGSAQADGPTVFLGDPYYPQYPMIRLERGAPLSSEWTHYEFPLSSNGAHRWRDADGAPLSPSEFRDFLATDPAIYFRAGFSGDAGETTDLDNVGIVPATPRAISLHYRGSSNEFYGRIKSDNVGCIQGAPVKLFRVKKGGKEKIGEATTDSQGKYTVSDPGKPGKYFSKVPDTELPPTDACAPDRSKTIKLD